MREKESRKSERKLDEQGEGATERLKKEESERD